MRRSSRDGKGRVGNGEILADNSAFLCCPGVSRDKETEMNIILRSVQGAVIDLRFRKDGLGFDLFDDHGLLYNGACKDEDVSKRL